MNRTNGFDEPDGDELGTLSAELQEMFEDARIEDIDTLTASRLSAILPKNIGMYTGMAQQGLLDAIRAMVGYLEASEREPFKAMLSASGAFRNQKQLEDFWSTCPPAPGEPRFKPMSLAEFSKRPPKEWLVDGVIGAGDLAMVYGPPGSGKTFIVIDLIFSACLGKKFAMSFDVPAPINVAYCAGEGVGGLPARFQAAMEFYGVDNLPNLTIFDTTPQLFDQSSADAIDRFVAEWHENQLAGRVDKLDLLVIDTMHSATLGADENSAQDIGKVLSAVKAATKLLGCTVLLVHHTNKQGTAERGSSALKGAMDTQIEIKPAASKYMMRCEKLKDGEAWKDRTFDLIAKADSVRIWWDEAVSGEDTNAVADQVMTIVNELRSYPGRKYAAKQIAEIVGCTQSTTIKLLAKMVKRGDVKRKLADDKADPSNRNPYLYYWEDAVSSGE